MSCFYALHRLTSPDINIKYFPVTYYVSGENEKERHGSLSHLYDKMTDDESSTLCSTFVVPVGKIWGLHKVHFNAELYFTHILHGLQL